MTKKSKAEKQAAVSFGLTNNNTNNLVVDPTPTPTPKIKTISKRLWFFATDNNRLRYGDNREIVVGETHTTDEKPSLCYAGLHGSPTVANALSYAPGKNLYRVTIDGITSEDDNDWWSPSKYCGTSRTYHAVIDVSPILDEHVRGILSQYLNKHEIKVNDDIKAFLNTGLNAENTLNNMTAVDIKNQKERTAIDYIWRACQAKITSNGFAKIQIYFILLSNLYYQDKFTEEDIYGSLDDKVLKAMNLTE